MLQRLPALGRLARLARHASRRYAPGLALLMGLLTAPLTTWAQAPANDDPCGAVTITANGTLCTSPTVGTNVGATTTTPNGYTNPGISSTYSGCGSATQPKDVWFKFTTAASGPSSFGAAITVTGNPAGSVRLFSAPSCSGPFTPVECSGSTASNTVAPRLTTGSLVPNTTYYVAVAGYSSSDTQGQFTICLTDGPGTPTCGAPLIGQFTSTGPTTGTLAFTPGVNNTAPFVFTLRDNTAQQSLGPFSTNTSPLTLTGLVAGHSYSVTVGVACATGGQATAGSSFTIPVPNDNPCGALPVPVGSTCTLVNGNNANATNSNVSVGTNCAIYAGRYDVWYTFTTAASGPGSRGVIVQNGASFSGGGAAGTFRVYTASSCNGSFTQIGCSTNFQSGGGPAQPLTLNGLTPNTTYYLRIDEGGFFQYGVPGAFSFCVLGTSDCAPPTQLQAGLITTTTIPLTWTAGNGNQSYTITYTAAGGTPQTTTATASPFSLSNLTPGTPYTISVVGNCSGGTQSDPTTITARTTITNDEPCGAVSLALSGASCTSPTAATTYGATATTPNGYPATGCGGSNSGDVWFKFTTAATGPASTSVAVNVTGTVARQVRAFSASACAGPFTPVGCSASTTSTAPPLVLTGLTPSTTYYVSVNGFGAQGDFGICVGEAPACASPSGLAASNVGSTTATLTFTPGVGATSYTVTYTPQGGTATTVTPAPTASPVSLTGLAPSTAYTATLQAICAAGQSTTLSTTFTTTAVPQPGPANDDCAGATPIPSVGAGGCTASVTSTTLNATSSTGAPDPGCGSYSGRDVWFSVQVPANGILQVETGPVSGSPLTDTGLALYSGSCGSLTLLGCHDDINTGGGNYFSRLRQAGLTPGSTVYVRVWPYNNTAAGQFTVCAQTDAACPAVTNLAASNLTMTSASLGFSASSAGTSYAVTYTPAGGTATTVTPAPTSSPVALTGLQPFTTYSVSVVANCAAGQTSVPATTTFTTTPYCVSGLGGACGGNDITNVVLPAATLSNASPGCSGVGSTFYTAYPATGSTTATLTAGQSYQLQVTTNGNSDVSVWIDYNRNGQFEASEWTQVIQNSVANLPATVTITVPATATPGRTGLRVRSRGAGAGNGADDACTQFGTGETEDYVVTLVAPGCNPASALTVGNITATTASLSFTPGSVVTSYTVTYTPQGGTATTVTPAPTAAPVPLTGLMPNTQYTVSVTSNCAGGQTSTAATTTFTTQVTATRAEALAAQVSLHPNPAQQRFILTLPAGLLRQPTEVLLYNGLGQVVQRRPLPAGSQETSFEVGGLPRGIYVLQLATPAGLISKRVVVVE